jgi:hypothetical protein
MDPVIMGYYEAFILYGNTIRRLFDAGANFSDGLTVAQAMWNITVRTPLQTDIRMTNVGDRVNPYDVRSFILDTGMHTVGLSNESRCSCDVITLLIR